MPTLSVAMQWLSHRDSLTHSWYYVRLPPVMHQKAINGSGRNALYTQWLNVKVQNIPRGQEWNYSTNLDLQVIFFITMNTPALKMGEVISHQMEKLLLMLIRTMVKQKIRPSNWIFAVKPRPKKSIKGCLTALKIKCSHLTWHRPVMVPTQQIPPLVSGIWGRVRRRRDCLTLNLSHTSLSCFFFFFLSDAVFPQEGYKSRY